MNPNAHLYMPIPPPFIKYCNFQETYIKNKYSLNRLMLYLCGMDIKSEFDKMIEGMDITPVVRDSLMPVNAIEDRMGDIMRSVKRLDMIRAGEYVGEMLVSVKDEISAVNAKKGMLELLGRWAKYEQPDVTNNNVQVNIIRTNAGENG